MPPPSSTSTKATEPARPAAPNAIYILGKTVSKPNFFRTFADKSAKPPGACRSSCSGYVFTTCKYSNYFAQTYYSNSQYEKFDRIRRSVVLSDLLYKRACPGKCCTTRKKSHRDRPRPRRSQISRRHIQGIQGERHQLAGSPQTQIAAQQASALARRRNDPQRGQAARRRQERRPEKARRSGQRQKRRVLHLDPRQCR